VPADKEASMSEQEKLTSRQDPTPERTPVEVAAAPAGAWQPAPRPTPRWMTAVLDQLDDHGLPPR
jgi:hypothetical protein